MILGNRNVYLATLFVFLMNAVLPFYAEYESSLTNTPATDSTSPGMSHPGMSHSGMEMSAATSGGHHDHHSSAGTDSGDGSEETPHHQHYECGLCFLAAAKLMEVCFSDGQAVVINQHTLVATVSSHHSSTLKPSYHLPHTRAPPAIS